jgi:hypothetical protein
MEGRVEKREESRMAGQRQQPQSPHTAPDVAAARMSRSGANHSFRAQPGDDMTREDGRRRGRRRRIQCRVRHDPRRKTRQDSLNFGPVAAALDGPEDPLVVVGKQPAAEQTGRQSQPDDKRYREHDGRNRIHPPNELFDRVNHRQVLWRQFEIFLRHPVPKSRFRLTEMGSIGASPIIGRRR